jgi:3D (Asp-Asp-Asp) domain-containing protein
MLVWANSSKKGMRYLLTTIGLAFLFATPVLAAEDSFLARITVYWPGEGQLRACSNGARLRAGHCAVDPKRIPFGSHVVFPDATCTAVDSGPAVVSRKAARMTGRTISQRNAIVIDRFFESKEAALSWESRHPRFMTVRIVPSGSRDESKEAVAALNGVERTPAFGAAEAVPKQTAPAVSLPKFDSAKLQFGLPLDSVLRPAQPRT